MLIDKDFFEIEVRVESRRRAKPDFNEDQSQKSYMTAQYSDGKCGYQMRNPPNVRPFQPYGRTISNASFTESDFN